jgi:hypothetical protein
VDKEALFAPRLPEDDVEVPGVGTVRVRALTRLEAMKVQSAGSVEATDRLLLSFGLVDPKLTEDEARRWQGASVATEIEPVSNRILELSGMAEGADKESYKSLRDGSEPGVRVLPSAEAGDDGGPASSGDAQ